VPRGNRRSRVLHLDESAYTAKNYVARLSACSSQPRAHREHIARAPGTGFHNWKFPLPVLRPGSPCNAHVFKCEWMLKTHLKTQRSAQTSTHIGDPFMFKTQTTHTLTARWSGC